VIRLDDGSAGGEAKPGTPRRRYFIDPEWYQRNGRLLSAFVESRMCPSCRRNLDAERAAPQESAVMKSRSKGAKRRPSTDPMAAIQSCCSKGDFITPRLPTLEAVFRLLLANGSAMDAVQIRDGLDSWPGCAGAYSHISVEMLEHLLDADNYYGFRPWHPESESQ